jgi:hypothetical protein
VEPNPNRANRSQFRKEVDDRRIPPIEANSGGANAASTGLISAPIEANFGTPILALTAEADRPEAADSRRSKPIDGGDRSV